MKRSLILSIVILLLAFTGNIYLDSLIGKYNSLMRRDITPLPISAYIETDLNLTSTLEDAWLSHKLKNSHTHNISWIKLYKNEWLDYYKRYGVIRAKVSGNSYVFSITSNVPNEFIGAVTEANLNNSDDIIFVYYGKLAEQPELFWKSNIKAVSDNGTVYLIPDQEKEKFITSIQEKRYAYLKTQDYIWYKKYLPYFAVSLIALLWCVPLCRWLKRQKKIVSLDINISFKSKK